MKINEILLYRGDAEAIDKFDVGKTSFRSLFGRGIYLTDNPEVAADYTLKGAANVVYSDEDATSQRDLLSGYIRKLIDDEIGWENLQKDLTQEWAVKNIKGFQRTPKNEYGSYPNLPGMPDSKWDELDRFLASKHKSLSTKNFPRAQEVLRANLPNYRVVKNTMGEWSLVTRQRTAKIASFDVPEEYLSRCLHAERPLPDNVLAFIRDMWIKEYDKEPHYKNGKKLVYHGMRDADENEVSFDDYIKNYKKKGTRYSWGDHVVGGAGQNPTFDELRNGTHGGSTVFTDDMFANERMSPDGSLAPRPTMKHDTFVTGMTKLGYVGIEYDGGARVGGYTRGGGGQQHRAFLFWNAPELEQFRLADTAPTHDAEVDPKASEKQTFSRLYRPWTR